VASITTEVVAGWVRARAVRPASTRSTTAAPPAWRTAVNGVPNASSMGTTNSNSSTCSARTQNSTGA
jgi:hypothetical protein